MHVEAKAEEDGDWPECVLEVIGQVIRQKVGLKGRGEFQSHGEELYDGCTSEVVSIGLQMQSRSQIKFIGPLHISLTRSRNRRGDSET